MIRNGPVNIINEFQFSSDWTLHQTPGTGQHRFSLTNIATSSNASRHLVWSNVAQLR